MEKIRKGDEVVVISRQGQRQARSGAPCRCGDEHVLVEGVNRVEEACRRTR